MSSFSASASRAIVLSFLVAVVGCVAETSPGDGEDLGVTQAAVQVQGLGYQFAVVQDGSRAAKATGAIEVPMRNPDGSSATLPSNTGPWWSPIVYLPVRGTCGVTFISPHYAVTAAHCVDQKFVPDPVNQALTVRQYDVSTADLSSLYAASQTKGSYPNYKPEATAMQNVAGYVSTAYSCKVVSRCAFGVYNCEVGDDVAMLYCSNRASSGTWLPVASAEQPDGPVDMYWFHELLAVFPIDPVPSTDTYYFDRFEHYTKRHGGTAATLDDYKKNWHYIGATTNALLPLKSIPFSNGAIRRRFGTGATNLFGCHGTSGSGILQRNPTTGEHELVGPASTAPSWSLTSLCNHPYDFQPTQAGLYYTSNASVQQLQSKYSKALYLDRYPVKRF